MKKKNVILIERCLPHYRLPFVEQSRDRLLREGVEFGIVYGQGTIEEAKKKDEVDVPWGSRIRNAYLPGGLVYQPWLGESLKTGLVIIEQANRLLLNYLLFGLKPWFRPQLAFIGHGYCHQDEKESLGNRFKSLYSNWADWWFPYTQPNADHLAGQGFPRDRMTVLENSIDTRQLAVHRDQVDAADLARLRKELGLGEGPTGIFCGGMYPEKQIPFLLEACQAIKRDIPGFHMIFVGDGVDGKLVREAASRNPWIHFAGPRFGKDKACHFLVADVFLMPGLVGLAILDSFTLGVPLATTHYPYHSPEIAYLRPGENGLISSFDAGEYSGMVAGLLKDQALRGRLKSGCRAASERYSMENMVERFCGGVLACLQAS